MQQAGKHAQAGRYQFQFIHDSESIDQESDGHQIWAVVEVGEKSFAQIERNSTCFRERHVKSSRPGDLLSQDTFYVGILKEVERMYFHAIVDI